MLLSLSLTASAVGTADYKVVPLPQSIEMTSGKPFVLNDEVRIYYQGGTEMERNAEFLASYINEQTGLRLPVLEQENRGMRSISLRLNERLALQSEEGFQITVSSGTVLVEAKTAAGVFYGIQLLRKSIPLEEETVELPAAKITDEPQYGYRGMHLDCGRHFFSINFIKEYIDMLALHNMNTFHWHLTDDQGWRLEIKRYPQLTEIGAWRSGTVIGNNSDVDDGVRYGGYYTQDQVLELVKYAAERYITVIPEIDIPGHTMSLLAAFPELGCTGGPYEVGHKWGVYNDVLCIGNPKTYEVVQNILDEVVQIFPSEVIHIGGDEVPTVRWESCPKCLVAKGENETFQAHFTHQIAEYLAIKHHRRIMAWDETLENGATSSTQIMSWRGTEPGVKAAEMGLDVIMTPVTTCYFDYYQTAENTYEPSITGMWPIDVEKVWRMEVSPDNLSDDAKSHIKGVQANVWTEYMGSRHTVEYMVLPRMAALSEVAWSKARRDDFDAFKLRLTRLVNFYDVYGWTYAKHLWPERMVKDRWHF